MRFRSVEEHFGRVYKRIIREVEERGTLVFLLIDPPDQTPEEAGRRAKVGEEAGVSAILVGGSLGAQGTLLDRTIEEIKANVDLPVILFPGNIATLSEKADALYFLYLMNSVDPYYISGAQTAAAFPVKRMGIEPIPTAYVIVEPGRAVGWVGRAQPIPRDIPYLAAAASLAGQYMGAHAVILESGSGAPEPVPEEMVGYVVRAVDVPVIVAGGVRDPEWAYRMARAGASILHVGTAADRVGGDEEKLRALLEGMVREAERGAASR